MTIKWCAFTGALMLFFALLTYDHQSSVGDPPGVKTRWWDGTMQSRDTYYSDGKLKSHSEYGNDGTTVNVFIELTPEGVAQHTKIRQNDGTVEEKTFQSDGKTPVSYLLWNGDEASYRIERDYNDDGTLQSEEYRTDDGQTTLDRREYDGRGNLQRESKILDNADQQWDAYQNGTLVSRRLFKANSDQIMTYFRADGSPFRKVSAIKLTGDNIKEWFDSSSRLVLRKVIANESSLPGATSLIETTSVFKDGQLVLRQTFSQSHANRVEEFAADGSTVVRQIDFDHSGHPLGVRRFRKDGTLSSVKLLSVNGDKVTKQIDYDATGTKITSERDGGEPEVIDPKLFEDIPEPVYNGGSQ